MYKISIYFAFKLNLSKETDLEVDTLLLRNPSALKQHCSANVKARVVRKGKETVHVDVLVKGEMCSAVTIASVEPAANLAGTGYEWL